MGKIRLNIDGRELTGFDGQTILEIARENGVFIPTLCEDARVKMYGSCGICVVEAEGSPKLLRSCSTYAADGMIITTDTARIRSSRKTALELLLSDHSGDCRPPCALACPGETDCQGYVGLIANGEYEEAYKLIREKIPLPASIGRVCPHPCEEACRRKLVEEPISIAALKAFAADKFNGTFKEEDIVSSSGKKVAIAGGGPGGLAAAYYLRLKGHEVTIYEAMPQMGGMLRYGIPEYRLPRECIQKEIDIIQNTGIEFKNNVKIGKDMTLEYLRNNYDAVVIAVGAWTSTVLRCRGEDLAGVYGGIDYLRNTALNNPLYVGNSVAVVGGGNTAMDAARTLVRLGVEKVYNIYRRTKNEMPAEEEEIVEAEQEGVIFKNLRDPIEIIGTDGRVSALCLQVMELGEPDASGRRAPRPVEGQTETIEVDSVIAAIGQKLNPVGFDGIELTSRKTIATDGAFRTNLNGVFAIGDATNKGADIAIAAIGEARRASEMIDKYLTGEEFAARETYLSKTEPAAEDFADHEKKPRVNIERRSGVERKGDFLEISRGLTDEAALAEASRCLECGCIDYFECRLIDLANQYAVKPAKYAGQSHKRGVSDDHPFIRRNPDKCILCGLCARVCEELIGQTALGLVGRGFDTAVSPAGASFADAGCISCGMCVTVCPTGALTERLMSEKSLPVREKTELTTCSFCSVGCQQKLTRTGTTALRVLPAAEKDKDALLCVKGRFGLGALNKAERITRPMIRIDGKLEPVSYEQAMVYTNKKLQALRSLHGDNKVAVTISDRYTNEDALLIKEYAEKALKTQNVFSFSGVYSGVGQVLGFDGSTLGFDAMENTQCILLVETDIQTPHLIAGISVKRALEGGAKLIVMNTFDSAADELADIKLNPGNSLSLLGQIVKLVLEGSGKKDIPGYEELSASLKEVVAGDEARRAADMYLKSKNSVILFEQNKVSTDTAKLLANLAVLSGHVNRPRAGLVQLKPGANTQGLADLGVGDRSELLELLAAKELKGLFIFGEDVRDEDLDVEFLAVQDMFLTETAKKADVVFPGASFTETDGSFTNTVGKRQKVRAAMPSPLELDNFSLLSSLSMKAAYQMPHRCPTDLEAALKAALRARVGGSIRLLPPMGDTFRREGKVENTNALDLRFESYMSSQSLKA